MGRAGLRIPIITAFLLAASLAIAADPKGATPSADPAIGSGIVPITTKSPEAHDLYLHAIVEIENIHPQEALQDFHKAMALDPDFALADIIIAFPFPRPLVDPAEQAAMREKAIAGKAKVSRGEQLIIDWAANVSEGHTVAAIQSMNEVLEEYPNDKHLGWLAGVWMENQREWKHAIPVLERTIRLDPEFAPPFNELAYCYAQSNMYDKAFDTMQRYIRLLPNEANPQDSYAEILRMDGRFDDALIHYHAALKIDPGFMDSQVGIADTYALMGDEPRARAEYAIAISRADAKSAAAAWSLNAAITYIREKDYDSANSAFRAVAAQAHRDDLGVSEAEAYRMMALYQTDGSEAMHLLKKAEDVLKEKHPMAASDREEELALIFRERASRAAHAARFSVATATLKQMREMLERSRDQNIQLAYDGAAGAVLVAQGKYEEALPHLEDDDHNPFSVKLMVTVYQNIGDKPMAEATVKRLANWNEPTLEQALVVPEFREKASASASSFHRM